MAKYKDDFPPKPSFSLGDGYEVIQRPARRPRRGPEPTARPFDAAVFRARDRDRTTDTKHTVSLMVELTELLTVPPYLADDKEERHYLIGAMIDELETRGFPRQDLQLLVVLRISTIVNAWTLMAQVATELGVEAAADELFVVSDDLRTFTKKEIVFNVDHDAREVSFGDNGKLLNALISWNLTQDLDAIIEWENLPSLRYLHEHSSDTHDGVFDRAIWMQDRFTETYAEEWSTTSLDLEWKYMHSQDVGCCSATQMQLRRMRSNDVSREIADRAVSTRTSNSDKSTFRTSAFTETAVELLTSGRHEVAAAMFNALRKVAPTDAELANNLAFCLLPTDPERALSLLDESSTLRGSVTPVNWANRAAALYLLERDAELAMLVDDGCPKTVSTAWLWTISNERSIVRLGSDVDIRAYGEDLRDRVAATHPRN